MMKISVDLQWLRNPDGKHSLFDNCKHEINRPALRHLDPWPESISICIEQNETPKPVTTFGTNLGERELIAFLLLNKAGEKSGARFQFPCLCSAISNLRRKGVGGAVRHPKWLKRLFGISEGDKANQRIRKLLSLDGNGGVLVKDEYDFSIKVDGTDQSDLSNEGRRLLANAILTSCRLYWKFPKKSSRVAGNVEMEETRAQLKGLEKGLIGCHRRWKQLTEGISQSKMTAALRGLSLEVSDDCFIGKSPIAVGDFDAMGRFGVSRGSGQPEKGEYSHFQTLFDEVNRKVEAEHEEEIWRLGFATKDELLRIREEKSKRWSKYAEEWCQSDDANSATAPVVPMTGTAGSTHIHKSAKKQCRWVLRREAREQT